MHKPFIVMEMANWGNYWEGKVDTKMVVSPS